MLDFDIGGGSAGWVEYKPARAAWRMPDDSGSVEDIDWKQAIFHFKGIRMGWQRWVDGQPEWVWDADNGGKVEKPEGEAWKRGFEVHITLLDNDLQPSSDQLRFNASQVGTRKGVRELYKQYAEEAPANEGKLPVVTNLGSQKSKATSIPLLRITQWIAPPSRSNGAASDVEFH